jgi:hypothetical protein
MSKRTILMFVLSILVLLGLVAGLFTGSIENALGTPQGTQTRANTDAMQLTPTPQMHKTNTSHPSPTATAQPQGGTQANTNQQNQQANMLATDTFQRPNQSLWGTASDGRQWGEDANTKPFFSINGLTGQIAGGQGPLEGIIGMPTDNVDITVSGIINQFGNNANFGAVLRWTDTNNWYKALVDGSHLEILKSVNNHPTIIAQMDVNTSAGVSQTIRFRSLGTMLFAKTWPSNTPEPQNWTIVTDDQTFTTGQFGIRVFEQPTTVITIMSFHATIASMSNDT